MVFPGENEGFLGEIFHYFSQKKRQLIMEKNKSAFFSLPALYLTKFNDKYEGCCHDHVCFSVQPIPFKAWYVILKAYKKLEYADFGYLLSVCNNINIKLWKCNTFQIFKLTVLVNDII